MKLNYTQIVASLKTCNYHIDEKLLKGLFSTVDTYKLKNTKSSKVLRNEIEHSLSVSAIEEVVNRRKELFNNMRKFITLVKK